MQLNPARGRKLVSVSVPLHVRVAVYAAQPREGTETAHFLAPRRGAHDAWFMQLNPARGRKLGDKSAEESRLQQRVYAPQPREGTESGLSPMPPFPLLGHGATLYSATRAPTTALLHAQTLLSSPASNTNPAFLWTYGRI